MSGHTPGPWKARDCELIGGDGTLLATLHWHSGRDAKNAADARLIALAPELLAALKSMVLNDVHGYRNCHKTALAAIAKAEGR